MKLRLLFFLFIFLTTSSCITSAQIELDGTDVGTLTFSLDSTSTNTLTLANQSNQRFPAYHNLISKADEALKSPLYAVTEKNIVPPSGNKHDYMSLARYAWPNPDTDDGLPYIMKDGQSNPELNKYDKIKLSNMALNAFRLSLAYHFTKDEKYASKTATLIKTWFLKEETYMNPNFKFGQSIPGVRKGGSSGLIESRDFIKVINAASLIYNSSYWKKEDHLKLKRWFKNFLEWMLNSSIGAGEKAQKNNHGTWYDAQIAVYAIFIGKNDLANSALNRTFSERVYKQITPDGKQPFELNRWTAQQYTWFNLDGILTSILIYNKINGDSKVTSSERIQEALNWLLPYALGEKEWNYKQITEFSECKYLKLYIKAYKIFKSQQYKLVVEQLTNSGCSGSQSLLLYPVE